MLVTNVSAVSFYPFITDTNIREIKEADFNHVDSSSDSGDDKNAASIVVPGLNALLASGAVLFVAAAL